MREYYKKVDNETINELMTSLEENEKAIRDMNEKRGLTIYTNHEICDVLGINEKLLRKYRYNGLLSYSKCGDKYWYTQTDIDEFMAKTNVKHFINTPYYNRRYTKLKIEEYDRKERNVTD